MGCQCTSEQENEDNLSFSLEQNENSEFRKAKYLQSGNEIDISDFETGLRGLESKNSAATKFFKEFKISGDECTQASSNYKVMISQKVYKRTFGSAGKIRLILVKKIIWTNKDEGFALIYKKGIVKFELGENRQKSYRYVFRSK